MEREVRLLVQIRPAKPGESRSLTALCVRSKAHWGYDVAFMKLSAATLNVNEDDIAAGRVRSVVNYGLPTLNIIACPSCSRVENQAFIDLAQQVKEMTRYAEKHAITIAVMGCRVNGPGETDDADLGLWCGPSFVNLKRGSAELGAYPYDQILPKLKTELDALIAQRQA